MMAWVTDQRFSRGAVISLGASRSGKTTLGQLLASFDAVDHVDEYWPLMSGAASVALDANRLNLFADSARAAIAELRNDNVLMRFANFRPSDESSVWKTKNFREIVGRLLLKSRRDAAEFIRSRRHLLILGATDCVHQLDAFVRAFSWAELILVVRHPLDVAVAGAQRGWYADTALALPLNNMPSKEVEVRKRMGLHAQLGEKVYLPWWLRSTDHQKFMQADEITRGLMYWEALHVQRSQLQVAASSGVHVVRFDDIIERPTEVVRALPFMTGRAPSAKTRRILRRISPPSPQRVRISVQARRELERLSVHAEKMGLSSSTEPVSR